MIDCAGAELSRAQHADEGRGACIGVSLGWGECGDGFKKPFVVEKVWV